MWRQRDVEHFPIEDHFPKLREGGYQQTSPIDFNQNCFGFVLGFHQWWETGEGSRWPKGLPDDTLAGWISVLEQHGFAISPDGSLQHGIEKVALYARDEEPLHVSRQATDGTWESKLGWGWDIKHNTLDSLEGDAYGTVTVFMQRSRRP